MFLLINLDDVEIGIGVVIKWFFIIGILSIPLGFLKWFDDSLTIGSIIFAFGIALYIMNILTIVEWINDTKEMKNDKKNKQIIALTIAIIGFIITSVIGFFIPIKIAYITLKGVVSMAICSFIINIFSGIWLQKKRIGRVGWRGYINNIKYFLKHRFLKQQLIIGLVSFFVISCIVMLGMKNDDLKNTKLSNIATNLSNYITSNVVYYNNKYESARNGKTVKEIAQDEINHIRNDVATNKEELNKLASYNIENKSVESFTKEYLNNKNIMKAFVDEYGINIRLNYITDDSKYSNLFIMTLHDYSTEKTLYYKFDLNKGEISEQFENSLAAEKYADSIKENIRNEKYN